MSSVAGGSSIESKIDTLSPIARRMLYGFIATLMIGVVIAVVIGVCAIRASLIAEKNYLAFCRAQEATLEYIQQNDGQWPTSWEDLRSIRPESDFDWVAEHVTFNFDADPRKIVSQTPDTFTAIVPNEPCYVVDDWVHLLIDTLTNHHQSN